MYLLPVKVVQEGDGGLTGLFTSKIVESISIKTKDRAPPLTKTH
jgi:hypothetical protein